MAQDNKTTKIQWHDAKSSLEMDFLESLTDEELSQHMEDKLNSLSEIERASLHKQCTKLQNNLKSLLDAERTKLHEQNGRPVLSAVADASGTSPSSNPEPDWYSHVDFQLEIGCEAYRVAYEIDSPREMLLIGSLPKNVTAIQIGNKTYPLKETKSPNVYRCQGLTRPGFESFIETTPLPTTCFVKA